MSFSLNINISFDWDAPVQRPPPPAAGTSASPHEKAVADCLAYVKNTSTKLSEAVGKPIPFYIDWSFTAHPAFAALNTSQFFSKWLREMIEYSTTHGSTLSYLSRDAAVKKAIQDHIDGILFYLDPENRVSSPVGNAQGKWYHLHIQNRMLVVSVNLEKCDATNFYDYETKFMGVFSPSPMVLSAIADAEKKFETEYSKKISDIVGRRIPIVVDWSFYKHPKFPAHPNGKKMIEKIRDDNVKYSTTYGSTLANILERNAFAKKLFNENVDRVQYTYDMDDKIASTVGPSSSSWFDLRLADRCLHVLINYDKYDSTSFNNYDLKFNALFNPSPEVLLAIEKSSKTIEDYAKKIETVLGRSLGPVVDWSFTSSPEYAAYPADQKKKCIEEVGNSLAKFASVNGESMSYLIEKKADIKQGILDKVDRFIIQLDSAGNVKATAGPDNTRWFDFVLDSTRTLYLRINMEKYDQYSFGGYETKLRERLFAAPVEAVVVAAPVVAAPAPTAEQLGYLPACADAIKAAETKIENYAKKLRQSSGVAALNIKVDWSFTLAPTFPGNAMIPKIPEPLVENALTYGSTLDYLLRDVHVKNAFVANIEGIVVRIDMQNTVTETEQNPGGSSAKFYALAIHNRQLILTVNYDNYDYNRPYPNFDMKFYALFKPSPLVLGLIEKADKKIEEINRKLDAAAGKTLPIKFDWSFLEHPKAAKENVSKMIPSLVDNMVTFTTTNGGTLIHMCEKRPEIKTFISEKIDTFIYRIDPTDSINDPSGVGGSQASHYIVSFAGRALVLTMNLNKWDFYSFGAFEPKINRLFFPPAEAPAPVVAAPIVIQPVEIKVSAPSTAAVEPYLPTKVVATPAAPTTSVVSTPPPAATTAAAAPAPAAAAPPPPAGFPAGARADLINAAQSTNKAIEEFRKKVANTLKKPEFNITFDWDLLVDPTFLARSDCTSIVSNLKGIVENSTVYSESIQFLVDRIEAFRTCFQQRVDSLVYQADPTNSIKDPWPNAPWYMYTYDGEEKTLYFRFNLEEYKAQRVSNIRERLEVLFDLIPDIIKSDLQKPITEWSSKLNGLLKIEVDMSFTKSPKFKEIPRQYVMKFATDYIPEMMRTTIHCDGISTALANEASKQAILERVDKLVYRFDPTDSIHCKVGQERERHWEPSFDDENRALVFTYNLSKYDERLSGNLMQKLDPLIDLTSLKLAARYQDSIKKWTEELNDKLGCQIAVNAGFSKISSRNNFKTRPEHEKSTLFGQVADQAQAVIESLVKFSNDLSEYKPAFLTFVKTIDLEYNFAADEMEWEPTVGVNGHMYHDYKWFSVSLDTEAKRAVVNIAGSSLAKLNKPHVASYKLAPFLQIAQWRAESWPKMAAAAQAELQQIVGTTIEFTLDNTIFYEDKARFPDVTGDNVIKLRHAARAATYDRVQQHLDGVIACLKDISSFEIGKTTVAQSIKSVHILLLAGGSVGLNLDSKILTLAIPNFASSEGRKRRAWFAEVEFLLRIHVPLWKHRAELHMAELAKEIPPALGGKSIPVVLDWGFTESEYFKSFVDGLRAGQFLESFSKDVASAVVRDGIVRTATNAIGKACIEAKVSKVSVSLDSQQGKAAISSFDAASGELKMVLQSPTNRVGFSELVQAALDLIIEIALNDCKGTKQDVTQSISDVAQHPVAINIDVTTFNRDPTFLEFRPETQSGLVHFLSAGSLRTLSAAAAFLKKFAPAVDALKSQLNEIRLSVGEAVTPSGIEKAISNHLAQLVLGSGVLRIIFPLAKVSAAEKLSPGEAILEWALPIAFLLGVDIQVGVLKSSENVKEINDRLSSAIGSNVALVVDWESIHQHDSVVNLTPSQKYTILQGAGPALQNVFYGNGVNMDSIHYILDFAPVKEIFAQNVKTIIAKFVPSDEFNIEKTSTGFAVHMPHKYVSNPPARAATRQKLETLFAVRPVVEKAIMDKFADEHAKLVQAVEAAAGKAVPVEFGWKAVIDSKPADYVSALNTCGSIFSGCLGRGGLTGLTARNATARHSLARVSKVVVRVDPSNSVGPHIGQFVHGGFDAVLAGDVLEIAGCLGARQPYSPDPNIEWVLAPEIARADERAELDRLERERIRMEQERREREERERREREERERREREERERREREEAKRREEDQRRYQKELAYYNERAAKVCVQCYGKAELKCPKCNGNGGKCSRCDGNRTIRCGTCAGTGKLDPWLRPPNPPH
eukprot:TRINITY_DN11439_c1_g1_i1.p1 TRINITY_DN11439_c1_g1~~TRINITY_DN11439_c1_g1_i1.p1  ORF type:complete len:2205 (-),score=677.74 TRINITY_DN11439_c1_g1_i1:61-6675(-)